MIRFEDLKPKESQTFYEVDRYGEIRQYKGSGSLYLRIDKGNHEADIKLKAEDVYLCKEIAKIIRIGILKKKIAELQEIVGE